MMNDPDIRSTTASLRYKKTAPQMTRDNVHEYAPALAWYTDEVLFGQNWARKELSKRDRSIVTVSALIAGAHTKQMVGHFTRALANGVKPVELQEIITHLAFHIGWPCAMSAVAVMQSVYETQGVPPEELVQQDTPLLAPGTETERHAALADDLGDTLPATVAFDHATVNGDLWRRPELSPRDRSLATVAALIAAGEEAAAAREIRFGLANGLKPTEIAEALTHLAFYAGWARATRIARAVAPLIKSA